MKRALLLILVYFVTAHWLVFGQERDKILHFTISTIGQVTCVAVIDEVIREAAVSNSLCALGVFTAGIMMEAGFFGQNQYDNMDILANTAGIGLGALIVRLKF